MPSAIIYPSGDNSDSWISPYWVNMPGSGAGDLWLSIPNGVSSPDDNGYISPVVANAGRWSHELAVMYDEPDTDLFAVNSGVVRVRARLSRDLTVPLTASLALLSDLGVGSISQSGYICTLNNNIVGQYNFANYEFPFILDTQTDNLTANLHRQTYMRVESDNESGVFSFEISEMEMQYWGNSSTTGTIPLYIQGHLVAETGIPLYIEGHLTVGYGIDLYIDGYVSASSGIDLFLKVYDIASGTIPFYLEGKPLFSGEQELPMYMWATESGVGGMQSTLPMYLESQNFPATIPLYLLGQESDTKTSTIPLYMNGVIKTADNYIDFFIKNDGVESSIPLYTAGKFINEFDPNLPGGALGYASSIPFVLWNPGASETLPLYLHNQSAESSIPLFTQGAYLSSGEIYFSMPGVIASSDASIKLYTHGF